ncbi:MAG: hypothetical protein LBF94_00030 [Puniceicoccales bacterium]|nr:hypothetical protein [Puniceicoccales bacterium]
MLKSEAFDKNKFNVLISAPKGGRVYMSIDAALRLNPKIKKVALVFFMGIGDYFLSTNFLQFLKQRYFHLSFQAFVSKNFDSNNSPLVGKVLEKNPHFDAVSYYDGHKNTEYWKNYDYGDCLSKVDDETLLLPMIYEFHPWICSRTEALCETFCLPKPNIVAPPIVYVNYEPSDKVREIFDKITQKMATGKYKGVLFMQLTSRSSSYTYPYIDELISQFIKEGYCILCVEKSSVVSDGCISIDTEIFDINESIKLVSMLKKYNLAFVTITSCFGRFRLG